MLTTRQVSLAAILIVTSLLASAAPTDEECLFCHGEANMTGGMVNGKPRSLYVNKEEYSASTHQTQGCVSCHTDVTDLPHPEKLKQVDCGVCHDQAKVYAQSLHAKALENGDKDAAGCQDCHGKHNIRGIKDPLSSVYPLNLADTCGKCHSNPAMADTHMLSMLDPSASYRNSIHGRAMYQKGNIQAANCASCHGAHDLLRSTNPNSHVYRFSVATTCGKCHSRELEQFKKSIHSRALDAGIKDAPSCPDCHGEHDILEPANAGSYVSKERGDEESCARCHNDERLMKRFGITVAKKSSYMDSYHKVATSSKASSMASCSSCHGAHAILRVDDPDSPVNEKNRPETCRKCHPEAGVSFASGYVHTLATGFDQKAKDIVRMLYFILIGGTIGGMLLHNLIHLLRNLAEKFQKQNQKTGTYQRFVPGMRLGHFLLFVSFVTLVISGFALRHMDSWWAAFLFPGPSGTVIRGVVHRIAAVVLIGVAFWNGVYLLFNRSGRKELWHLIPGPRDLFQAFSNVFYMLGLSSKKPQFNRYSYIEKAEFWGMWWGTGVMMITGFSMWFVNLFFKLNLAYGKLTPKLILDLFALIHYYEAILAVLTILVWHFYFTIFAPDVYPMNWSWITGRITLEDLEHHHPLEYEKEVLDKNTPRETREDSASGVAK